MIATGASVGAGMSLMIAIWSGDAAAAAGPQVYRFGDHTVIVQPGPTAAPVAPKAPDIVPASHQQEDFPPRNDAFATTPPPPAEFAPAAADPQANGLDIARRYRQIYNAIPFDRVEYEANPSYRHEAAMEMLFGKLRSTVMHRSHTTIDVNTPPAVVPAPYSPYGFNSYFFPFFSPGVRVHRSF